jgi:hypothetical protein
MLIRQFPPSGSVEGFHLQVTGHAEHAEKQKPRKSRGSQVEGRGLEPAIRFPRTTFPVWPLTIRLPSKRSETTPLRSVKISSFPNPSQLSF